MNKIEFETNPILDWTGKHGLPDFAAIDENSFRAAFDQAIAAHKREIAVIAESPEPASFENTIIPLELAGKSLSRVSALFWNRAGAHTNDTIRALEREISPVMSRHYSEIAQNRPLFERVDTVWQNRKEAKLGKEELRVIERYWKGFVRAGANLDPEDQKHLAEMNERLATLGTSFGQNVLSDESSWRLFLTKEEDLAGLPKFLRDAMAQAAGEAGKDGAYAVTLSRSIIEPFLTFSDQRELREKAFRAWISRGEGENDNRPIAEEILALRKKKALLLGYDNYAAYKLEDTMAKTPAAVDELLMPVWQKACERAGSEAEALSELIAEEGRNHDLEAWDWRHYAEKLRTRQFDFSESQLKPYLQLDRIIEAAFDVAGRLFSVRFRPIELKTWHEDVRAFEVIDSDDKTIGLFFADYFARSSKRSGAWMSGFQASHKLDGGELPIIYNIMNFAKPAEGSPALLSMDDAKTLFHEFGHALHGLLSDVTYPRISGTSVSRDFVELPSQLFEHWLTQPDILKKYAVHFEDGQAIPDKLVEKVLAAEKFNSGFQTVEFTASALVDMAYHTADDVSDIAEFEANILKKLGMPGEITMRHRTPHFLHIFSGDGYSAGYYSYMWSEVLDADAFQAFEETGDAFDPDTAQKLQQFIYGSGGSMDPEDAYVAFRGKLPSPDAMMEGRGLI
ncbi:MAG: M3 family metallopeptidase [Pseudomonadota bacterium]